jgi:hypothetical protein
MSGEAKLYDTLQAYFGIGSYDEHCEREPWYKARMNEVGKLKRLLKARHVTVETMAQAAEYAHARHIPITETWQLIDLIPDARRAAREAAQRPLSARLQEAAAAAVDAGEMEWAMRLSASTSQETLDAWEAHHG